MSEEPTPPYGIGGLLRELHAELAEIIGCSDHPESAPGERGSDLQVYRNLVALAPFANPEHLPPLKRNLDGSRAARIPPRVPPRTPPRGIPLGVPHRRGHR